MMSWRPTWLASPDWAEGLNFAGPRVRTSFWGWALLAFGLMGAWHAADLARQVQAEHDEAQATLARLERGQQQQGVQVQAAAQALEARQGAVPVLKEDGLRQAAQLALWLGHPWGPVLDEVDEAARRSGVVLMQFSLDLSSLGPSLGPSQGASGEGAGPQPELRLQATATDDVAALKWLQALGPRAAMRSREPLSEPYSAPSGQHTLRVDVTRTGGAP